jgi:release factor glutamine methyltransferase
MTVAEAVRAGAERLGASGSETPRLDSELLLGQVLGVPRIELYTSFDRPVTAAEARDYDALLTRRELHEPVAYILGAWGFRRLTLTVDRRALIPRPETEIVVERCLALLDGAEQPQVLDVGTGTGAIALAIADEHPTARVTGIDASADALDLARENRTRTRLDIELERRDLFADFPRGPWQLVVSNPPYVDPEEIDSLMPDVRDWEPHLALVGHGATETIATAAAATLARRGALVLEVGDGQAPAVAALLEGLGFHDVRATPDLAGRDRVVEGRR